MLPSHRLFSARGLAGAQVDFATSFRAVIRLLFGWEIDPCVHFLFELDWRRRTTNPARDQREMRGPRQNGKWFFDGQSFA